MNDEDRSIIEEFERLMRQNAESEKQKLNKTEEAEAKVWHDKPAVPNEFSGVDEYDDTLKHRQDLEQQTVYGGGNSTVRTESKPVIHDEARQVIHRDNEALEHDKAKIYTEKPLIEETPIEHVVLPEDSKKRVKVVLKRSRLMEAVLMAEILGRPRGMQ